MFTANPNSARRMRGPRLYCHWRSVRASVRSVWGFAPGPASPACPAASPRSSLIVHRVLIRVPLWLCLPASEDRCQHQPGVAVVRRVFPMNRNFGPKSRSGETRVSTSFSWQFPARHSLQIGHCATQCGESPGRFPFDQLRESNPNQRRFLLNARERLRIPN